MSLTDYVTLGRSGLRVSPLSLGTMTFGTEWGWGSDEPQAREIFDRYTDQGGNFVDTANMYTQGKSEQMVGKFIADKKLRDRVVRVDVWQRCDGRSQSFSPEFRVSLDFE